MTELMVMVCCLVTKLIKSGGSEILYRSGFLERSNMSVTEKEILTFLTRYLEAHPRQRGVDLSTLEAQWPVATADLVDLLTSMVAHNTLIKRWDQYAPA